MGMGVDYHDFRTEKEQMTESEFPIPEAQQKQWLRLDYGFGQLHRHVPLNQSDSNGGLSCALGHHHIWELINDTVPEGKWAIVLEDDAQVGAQVGENLNSSLVELFRAVPRKAEIAFLDDRHCEGHNGVIGEGFDPYAPGATAYAITPAGARELLALPFQYVSDHALNKPINAGRMIGYCPGHPLFFHEYTHPSTIHDKT